MTSFGSQSSLPLLMDNGIERLFDVKILMVFLGVMVCFLNWRQLKLHQTLALTTSAALLIVGFAGVLCGQGHTFTPVAVAIITAALRRLSRARVVGESRR
jgi:uncharacterized membrane protein (DUF4010 family)